MRAFPLALIMLILLGAGCSNSELHSSQNLRSQADSISYAVGMALGKTYQEQEVEIVPSLVYQGLRDYLFTDTVTMSDSLMQQLLARMEEEVRRNQEARLRQMASQQESRSQAFLDSNRQVAGVRELSSGLQYQVIEEGLGTSPVVTSKVKIIYRGRLLNGEEFGRTAEEPVLVTVEEMIPGITMALTYMKPGGLWRLFIPPHLAYGNSGRPPSIPPNAVLIYDLRLLEIVR